MANTNKFTLRQGFAGTITITVKDNDGAVVNLTGATIYFDLKNKKSDTSFVLQLNTTPGGEIVITDATGGIMTIAFTQAQTIAMLKNMTAELVIKYGSTDVVVTKDIHVLLDKAVRKTAV